VKTILLPVDGSPCAERATQYVIALAREGVDPEVHLMYVGVPIESAYLRRFVTQEMIDGFHREEADAALRSTAALLDAAGVRYRRVVEVGHPAEAIARHATQHGCDSIVMGTRGMGSVGNLVLGSIATRVLHLAGVPVTLVK